MPAKMQVIGFLTTIAILVSSVTAQSTASPTNSAATNASTGDLTSMVKQLPTCSLDCLQENAADVNCSASDLPCLCSKSSDLVQKIGPCILLSSGCSSDEQNTMTKLASNICSMVNSSTTAELQSASSVISSALSSNSKTSGSSANNNLAMSMASPILSVGIMSALSALAALVL